MNCAICRQGTTRRGTATVTLERDSVTIVVKNVPADVCDVCGEEYVSEEITTQLIALAAHAATAGIQIEVRDFLAA